MLEHLYFDHLIAHIREQFKQVTDKRSEINTTKPLADALLSGLAMFSLKDSSLLQFVERMKERGSNLKSIFKIKVVMSDTTVRKAIDPVGPKQLKAILAQPVQMLADAGVLASYECLGGHLLVPIDGTGYFSSREVHCENCCEKHHRDGEVTYYHNALSAVIVHPGQREVFPVAMEEITKQDGATKNDCELSAVKRLLPQIRQALPQRKLAVVEDAMFCNAPHIRDLNNLDLRFIIRIKEGYALIQFQALGKKGETETFSVSDGKTKHLYEFANGLVLNGSNQDMLVNLLHYEQRDIKTGAIIFMADWITDFHLSKNTVAEVAKAGRARWKIENETFNTLKNQGYQFEHNFGHGQQNLSTNFALLMMLAFVIDQIQQRINRFFRAALAEVKRLTRLWERVREIFDMVACNSMETIYKIIAKELKLKIEIIV
jgi:hypothetical protein